MEQIRLILGSQNSIVVNNVSFPLITPSAQESGLKLQVHHLLKPDLFTMILLDFDANQSIVVIGNGNYILKPIIRTVEIAMEEAESIDDNEAVFINQLKFPKHPENKNRELANIWH